MIETKSYLDIRASLDGLSAFQTHDGNWLVTDPEVGTVSAPSQQEAEQEIRRRKAALQVRAA